MELKGISLDFADKKTCGLLPHLCLEWDEKYDQLEDNQKLIDYWDKNIKKVLSQTTKIVNGNIGSTAIIYSADKDAIKIIKNVFNNLELSSLKYDDIIKFERWLLNNYLK